MGKNQRNKKFLREEKSKVKLKKKKLLPKGQNVTDTSFKVKKIVIREQLKAPSSEEPLSSRKLNLKELFTRLQHHNTTMRQDALKGLNELVTNYPDEVLDGVNLPQLIENVTRLSLECESSVRRNALKFLDTVFKKVDESHILPLLDVLLSYMCCAMTHINHSIQEDSLLLLDAALDSYPNLMARHVHTILPRFLDMISRLRTDSKPGRMLTVNLGSRLTSVRWRIQVLARLYKLMTSLVDVADDQAKEECQTIVMDEGEHYIPLVNERINGYFSQSNILYNGSGNIETTTEERELIQSYVKVLIPLLFETWIEAAPVDSGDDANSLGEENAALLKCILGLLSNLWKYLRKWEITQSENKTMSSWFRQQSCNGFREHIMAGFPYSMNSFAFSDKRERREQRRNMQLLTKSGMSTNFDTDCLQQNLTICWLACCLLQSTDVDVFEKVLDYVTKCLESSAVGDGELLPVLRELFLGEARIWSDLSQLSFVVVKVISDRPKLVNMLCEIVSRPDKSYLGRNMAFRKWIIKLPDELCKRYVSFHIVEAVHQLLSQGNTLLLQHLCDRISDIIKNLPLVTITDTEKIPECKKRLLNAVYWVTSYDKKLIKQIERQIQTEKLDSELKLHIAQILEIQSCV